MLVYEHIPNGTLMDSLSGTFNSLTTSLPCMLTKTKKLTIDIYPIKKKHTYCIRLKYINK